jgi:hypothetical protein
LHRNDCIYKEAEPHMFSFIACNSMKITTDEHTCTETIVFTRRQSHILFSFIACNNMEITTNERTCTGTIVYT